MEKIVLTQTQEDYTITLTACLINKDLLLTITGGDVPHIGTVTTYTQETHTTECIRFPSHDGRFHKDDVLATKVLKNIQAALPGNCVITVGVHVNHITPSQIRASFIMVNNLSSQLYTWLTKPHSFTDPVYYPTK